MWMSFAFSDPVMLACEFTSVLQRATACVNAPVAPALTLAELEVAAAEALAALDDEVVAGVLLLLLLLLPQPATNMAPVAMTTNSGQSLFIVILLGDCAGRRFRAPDRRPETPYPPTPSRWSRIGLDLVPSSQLWRECVPAR